AVSIIGERQLVAVDGGLEAGSGRRVRVDRPAGAIVSKTGECGRGDHLGSRRGAGDNRSVGRQMHWPRADRGSEVQIPTHLGHRDLAVPLHAQGAGGGQIDKE
ncbi:MAG: hypothetical protein ACK56F_28875, partial [bacterium]